MERPVTFREPRPGSSREEREEHCLDWIARARHAKDRIILLVPSSIYADGRHGIFLCGWTLFAQDDEVRTHQCVVFLRDDALPIGACDQGVLCVADPRRLSAWDGRTEDQSRAQAA